jgi:hypothetical protein
MGYAKKNKGHAQEGMWKERERERIGPMKVQVFKQKRER